MRIRMTATRETAEVRITAADGFELAASAYAAAEPVAAVVVAPATGVRRRLYEPMARFLAERGLAVVVPDWRGTGGSRPRSLRGFRATMRQWAELDLTAAIEWAEREWPGKPLVVLGHSFGGQGIGLSPAAPRLRAIVTVAAQNGWWGHWPLRLRPRYAALWNVAMPGLAHAFGYFPGRRLGFGEDLPKGVALEWAGWCRRAEYIGDWGGHGALRVPLLAWSFADDGYAPRTAVDALHTRYSGATIERRHVTPREAGVERIEHFGFFKPGVPALWDQTAEWIIRVTAAEPHRDPNEA
jgi:predicted alpha/beta hydrolase